MTCTSTWEPRWLPKSDLLAWSDNTVEEVVPPLQSLLVVPRSVRKHLSAPHVVSSPETVDDVVTDIIKRREAHAVAAERSSRTLHAYLRKRRYVPRDEDYTTGYHNWIVDIEDLSNVKFAKPCALNGCNGEATNSDDVEITKVPHSEEIKINNSKAAAKRLNQKAFAGVRADEDDLERRQAGKPKKEKVKQAAIQMAPADKAVAAVPQAPAPVAKEAAVVDAPATEIKRVRKEILHRRGLDQGLRVVNLWKDRQETRMLDAAGDFNRTPALELPELTRRLDRALEGTLATDSIVGATKHLEAMAKYAKACRDRQVDEPEDVEYEYTTIYAVLDNEVLAKDPFLWGLSVVYAASSAIFLFGINTVTGEQKTFANNLAETYEYLDSIKPEKAREFETVEMRELYTRLDPQSMKYNPLKRYNFNAKYQGLHLPSGVRYLEQQHPGITPTEWSPATFESTLQRKFPLMPRNVRRNTALVYQQLLLADASLKNVSAGARAKTLERI